MPQSPESQHVETAQLAANDLEAQTIGIGPKVSGPLPATAGVRFNVGLSNRNHEELKKASRDLGKSISEIIRDALRVYLYLLGTHKEGKQILIGKNNRPEKEVVLFS